MNISLVSKISIVQLNAYFKGWPQISQNLFIKNCVFILTCLKLGHLQRTLHLMQYTYRGGFPTAQNSFGTHRFWCLLVLLLFFVSPLTSAKRFALRTFFIQGNQKSHLGWDQVSREGGEWESCSFCSKTAEHSSWCGQVHL